MRRFRFAVPVAAMLALALAPLAACKKEAVVAKDESVESVAKKVAAVSAKPKPGRWESQIKIDKMEMPGMTPEARAAMGKQMAGTQTFASCLTPEEVAKLDGNFFQQAASGCKYDRFVMADGKLEGEMTCGGGQHPPMKMTMDGTYGDSSYSMRVVSQVQMGPGRSMDSEMTITSQRTGECKGTEAN
jgi:hypothetical protein